MKGEMRERYETGEEGITRKSGRKRMRGRKEKENKEM